MLLFAQVTCQVQHAAMEARSNHILRMTQALYHGPHVNFERPAQL